MVNLGCSVFRPSYLVDMADDNPRNEEIRGDTVPPDEEILEEVKEYPLSNFDIQEFLKDIGEPITKIFTYPELKNARHIDEMLDRHGRAIMLFLTEGDSKGHWIAILRRGNTIELYDPYGYKPDTQHVKLGGKMSDMKRWGQDAPLFSDLVKRGGYRLIWNKRQRQPVSSDVNTCGRHSVMRLLFSHLPLDKYDKMLDTITKKTGVKPDDLVAYVTGEILEK